MTSSVVEAGQKDLLEWEHFNNNVLHFQNVVRSDAADNYPLFIFCFVESWANWINWLNYQYAEIMYKISSYFKDIYKSIKRRAVRYSTVYPHNNQLKGLHKNLSNADSSCFFIKQFSEPKAPNIARLLVSFRSVGTQTIVAGNHSNNLIPSQASGIKTRRADVEATLQTMW